MLDMTIHAIGFFIGTILIQYLAFKFRKEHNRENSFFTGNRATLTFCVMVIITNNINTLGSIIGFLTADEIGKAMEWHK